MTRAETSARTLPGRSPVMHVGILTYNGLSHTQRCLSSLAAHTRAPWRALVRDNASHDDTPAWLRAIDDPRITVHCGEDNLGVGGGRNWLLEQLLPAMGDDDLVVLLDNDIELCAGWETPFLHAFATRPRLGVAGRWAYSMLVHDGWRDLLDEQGTADSPVDTVQGCVFWIRASAARDIGLFDTALGRFWHEDDDYSMRALARGWEVRRVDTDAIVHHEHGSGVALRADTVLGSARNQAYLTRKWRELGVLDAEGVPRRPTPDDHAGLQAQLTHVLGRRVLRTELNSALVDATLLLHGEPTLARTAVLATPAVRALLDLMAAADPTAAGRIAEVQAQIATLLEERRRSSPAEPHARAAGGRSFSAVCAPAAWDDPRWTAASRTALRDGRGLDYYARAESGWRDGQLLFALRTLGALRSSARVLLLGRPAEPLVAALSHVVGTLVLADEVAHATESMQAHARQPLGTAVLQSRVWSPHEAEAYDVVLAPNVSAYTTASGLGDMLGALAAMARPTGLVAIGLSVRIAGPADGLWAEIAQCADDVLLRQAGLQRVGAFDARIADETLLAAVPVDAPPGTRPRLARLIGAHCLTLATLVMRRI